MSKRRVAYYYDHDVGSFTYGLGHPMKPQRMRLTHELVSAYGMLDKMHILRAKRASAEAMTRFHTDEYVDFLSRVTPETADSLTFHGTRFLVGDDNPAFEGVFEFCSISAGGSIAAAQRLLNGGTDIAINWAGGLHHAKKREASGFCYINDIVLAILEMLRLVQRVLYIDIDCHHGDGVEEAFYTTDRVMTCSFHKFGEYFPGTGTQQDRGRGRGRGYAINVPLKDGITDETYRSVFEPVIDKILEIFQPNMIVLQCGADSLSGDKLGCFNLTMQGHANCVQYVRKRNIPFILVGGGGYTVKNVARTWAYETACALGIENEIDPNLPWNEYFEWFGPRYRLEVVANNMDDVNVKEDSLNAVRDLALKQLSDLQPAPSVGMHDVPRESVGVHLGIGQVEEDVDERDKELAQTARFVYGLQEAAAASNESDRDDEYFSDESSSSRRPGRSRSSRRIRGGKKRMSLLTGQMFDVPRLEESAHGYYDGCGHEPCGPQKAGAKRRFFQSVARWDEQLEKTLAEKRTFTLSSAAQLLEISGDVDGLGMYEFATMLLIDLPIDVLISLPGYLDSLDDLHSLILTSRCLYRTASNPTPSVLRSLVESPDSDIHPYPHILIAVKARALADWAVQSSENRAKLFVTIAIGGPMGVLELALSIFPLTLADLTCIYSAFATILNPAIDILETMEVDEELAPCNDVELSVVNYWIYCDLFHHNITAPLLCRAAGIPAPIPLGNETRLEWMYQFLPDCDSNPNVHDAHELHDMRQLWHDGLETIFRTWISTMPPGMLPLAEDDGDTFFRCASHMGLISLKFVLLEELRPNTHEDSLAMWPEEIKQLAAIMCDLGETELREMYWQGPLLRDAEGNFHVQDTEGGRANAWYDMELDVYRTLGS
ncbi:Histone deacetylase RPD3 [Grifola frondosa]|uniref:histone deacetylase n=1 Tax=Grifola frondosa TaxID=5627 RepID=A0A1C7MRY1_GRIFR|nr:Histone deacetylase RPD3 [Grifola frondosa]